ncbi:hypothetical protein HBI56_159830 [Parastagonospora nodorum]|uniref:Uncharacterized protein n=1 Tax=Phaeosphaeria nodorum (strain SN15 / ATCC MYA-4574 / FGSC 10173) TaxID=321614 RepID=A0A7U2ETA9_PHANO|nr:hypothetical protein HBH56_190550 [Parastagonospora nodorum]QRC92417.1 hypothetical protein JI435_025280 [Parastagonospora nodorum SN15]KAH3925077.1 hypothetical protein HBH54_186360 [Parastagonospora nodorum]KAH3963791.1 hypothetical protein HBH51_165530 [Parastagonospora nodorum]KAH3967825.1 hypothetical protein HBH52_182760 [Parastagonospora nodorum]
MSSYLQKLKRQSKQFMPQSEGKKADTAQVQEATKAPEPPKIQEPATTTAGPSGPVPTAPTPTVAEPADHTEAEPVLDEEDQVFLERLAAIASEPEGEAPPLPTRPVEVTEAQEKKMMGRDPQVALLDGAEKLPLPTSPPEVPAESGEKGKEKAKGGLDRKKSVMSYFSLDRFKKGEDKVGKDKTEKLNAKDRSKMADDLQSAAEAAKADEQEEQRRENKELTDVLDQLNLSAVNNRVFSFTKESEELLNKFTQVLKDIINGAPTAYNDLEKLFTDYDAQLKKMYGGLPPFLQNMVKSLPAKLTATLGPELLAAGAEKPGFDAKTAGAGTKSKKSKIPGLPTIPSLKSLVTAQGAVATALRSIVNFLKFRFPMLATGTNLIMSLAVFLLLFVFWYCHKRGRETRLEKERLAADEGESARASSASSINEDADSIFGEKPKRKPVASSVATEQPTEPLIIQDSNQKRDDAAAAVADMPSVSHLPGPQGGKAPGPA